jgi:hypothetical protein
MRQTGRVAAMLLLAVLAGGCRRSSGGFERFVPDSAAARKALVAALEAWRRGRAAGAIDGISPRVVVVDTHRRADQALEGYEILNDTPGDNFRGFAVRLILSHPEERALVRFNVFGIDPLWVFRQEDYDMISHWEHAMGDLDSPQPTDDAKGSTRGPE